jgi:hypothetical protein
VRSPARIDTMCDIIAGVWQAYPDLRLGQLLVNAVGVERLFYIEDDDLMHALTEYVSRESK